LLIALRARRAEWPTLPSSYDICLTNSGGLRNLDSCAAGSVIRWNDVAAPDRALPAWMGAPNLSAVMARP